MRKYYLPLAVFHVAGLFLAKPRAPRRIREEEDIIKYSNLNQNESHSQAKTVMEEQQSAASS